MAPEEELVLFEGEDETRYYKWQFARVELNPVASAITIHGYPRGKPTITLPVSEITSCEIVQREGISSLGRMLFGWLTGGETGDVGCFLALILWPVAVIDAIVAKKTSFPVIKLSQSTSIDSEQGWAIHLRSRRRGQRGRAETREIAHPIMAFLRQNGYSGPMPDLGSRDPTTTVDAEHRYDDCKVE